MNLFSALEYGEDMMLHVGRTGVISQPLSKPHFPNKVELVKGAASGSRERNVEQNNEVNRDLVNKKLILHQLT